MILNNNEVQMWKAQFYGTGRRVVPVAGPPPAGMYDTEYQDAPTEMVLGFVTSDGGDSIMYEFSQNTRYFRPITEG